MSSVQRYDCLAQGREGRYTFGIALSTNAQRVRCGCVARATALPSAKRKTKKNPIVSEGQKRHCPSGPGRGPAPWPASVPNLQRPCTAGSSHQPPGNHPGVLAVPGNRDQHRGEIREGDSTASCAVGSKQPRFALLYIARRVRRRLFSVISAGVLPWEAPPRSSYKRPGRWESFMMRSAVRLLTSREELLGIDPSAKIAQHGTAPRASLCITPSFGSVAVPRACVAASGATTLRTSTSSVPIQ